MSNVKMYSPCTNVYTRVMHNVPQYTIMCYAYTGVVYAYRLCVVYITVYLSNKTVRNGSINTQIQTTRHVQTYYKCLTP